MERRRQGITAAARPVVRTVVAVILVGAALSGCGSQERPDADDWGPIGPVQSASPGETEQTEQTETDAADPGRSGAGTMSVDELTPEQAQLHAEMVLFEEIARAEVGDGSGGSNHNFRDDESDFGSGLIRPEGITVADEYELMWSDGELDGFVLHSDSGLRMDYSDGVIAIAVAVDAPQHDALRDLAEQVATAASDWREAYDEFPSFSSDMDTFTLQTDLFDENESRTVEIPKPDDVRMGEYVGTGDGFTVVYESETTGERAQITQDGLTFTECVEIV